MEISLEIQWIRLHVSTAAGMDLIPGQGAKIPLGTLKKNKKWYHNTFKFWRLSIKLIVAFISLLLHSL